jgi:hypothetical protein
VISQVPEVAGFILAQFAQRVGKKCGSAARFSRERTLAQDTRQSPDLLFRELDTCE